MNAEEKKRFELGRLENQKQGIISKKYLCDEKDHNWSKPYVTKVLTKDIIGYEPSTERGMDEWSRHAQRLGTPILGNVLKDGWERQCKICGEIQQTTETKEVTKVIANEPKFK